MLVTNSIKDIFSLLEHYAYFSGWSISDIKVYSTTNDCTILLKSPTFIDAQVLIKFSNTDLIEFDNTKFTIIARNNLALEHVNCIFIKKGDREVFDRIEFNLANNRRIKIRYQSFSFQEV